MKQLPWICILVAVLLFGYVEYRDMKARIVVLQSKVESILSKADESIGKTRGILERVDTFIESLKRNKFFQEEPRR